MKREIRLLENLYAVSLNGAASEGDTAVYRMAVEDGAAQAVSLRHIKGVDYELTLNGECHALQLLSKGGVTHIHAFGRDFQLTAADPVESAMDGGGARQDSMRAPMPGMVVEVNVAPGDQVTEGQLLMTIESMKILTMIQAWRDGVVDAVAVSPGESFDKQALLLKLQPEAEGNSDAAS